MHRKVLGRGLEALIPGGPAAATAPALEERPDGLRELAVDDVLPNPFQPRTRFDDDAIQELAASIKVSGVLQPVVVRKGPAGDYQLVAGERRLRASRIAGLQKIPAIIREVGDREMMEMALIENIQRENLNPIEEAAGLQRLIDEFRMTHEQAAAAVGRSRSATTNLLRLLRLARPVQEMVMQGALEMGHARALLALDGARQVEAANRIAARGLSVRESEALSARLLRGPATTRGKRKTDRDLVRLEEEISERLGTSVQIRPGRKGSGTILVRYSGLDHLDQLLKKLR